MGTFDVDPDRAMLPDAWRNLCRLLDRYQIRIIDVPGDVPPADTGGYGYGDGPLVAVAAVCSRCPAVAITGRRFNETDLGHRDDAVGELVTQLLLHEQEEHTGTGFRCPECGMVTYHPNDVRERYCPACHWWTGNPELLDAWRQERRLR